MELALNEPILRPLASEAARRLLEALRDERGRGRSVSLTGLPGPAKAFHLLALHHETGRPLAIVARSDAEAEALLADLRALAPVFALADPATIHVFPSLDADPYQGLAPHLSRVAARVRALSALAIGTCHILVVSVEALFTPLEPPAAFAARCRKLEIAADWKEADDPSWFLNAGYERTDMVSAPGEYSRRGGVVDIFTPSSDAPVRIELYETLVESMRRFDPAGQRSTEKIDACWITPARELTLDGTARAALSRALMRSGEGAAKLIALLERQGRFPGVETCARLALPETATLVDHAAGHLLVVDEPEMTREESRNLWADLLRSHEASPGSALPEPSKLFVPFEEVESILTERTRLTLRHLRVAGEEEGGLTIDVNAAGARSFRGRPTAFVEEARRLIDAGEVLCVVMNTAGTAQRVREVLEEAEIGTRPLPPGPPDGASDAGAGDEAPDAAGIYIGVASISAGFSLPESRWHLVGETELFGARAAARPRSAAPSFASDFRDLKIGDCIVHIDHGIGRYDGLSKMASGAGPIGAGTPVPTSVVEAMILTYQNNDRLYVPIDRLDLVQKYNGAGGKTPVLDRLGGQGWVKTKRRVKKEMEEMAVELLNLYAARKTITGHAFAQDTSWQQEFEAAFPFTLTPDQARAIAEVKRDMEAEAPMDRLLCGDVGFGKTEVALRAAFKSVMDGRQVAVLAPTTVLAFQHLNTFSARFAPFPVKVEMLSRFRTAKEQAEIVARAAAGDVDILIGTHRLLSKDVGFRRLGLLIVDEEQRFGVTHKEKIKQLKRNVDVLTLTATPIPRTLQMAVAGVLDLSIVETPPESRLAIQTHLVPFKESIIAPAIRHELQRGGQAYFVHNRVESIYAAAALVQRLVPEARIIVAHGQMSKDELEDAMLGFTGGKSDVLVSTTIIENGIDIPRVNTLIVNRADRFGLSQLYQLRGRIGRSDRQAYAYLLVPPDRTLDETARRRLQVLQDFSDLGSGFRIAAMDLEIRGAGSLLGHKQHGHIAAVGFEMYSRMLQRTIEEMKGGGAAVPETRTQLNLHSDLRLPETYIPEEGLRLVLYKKIASARSEAEIDAAREEMEDRFGRLPAEGERLLDAARVCMISERLGITQIDHRGGVLTMKFSEASPLDPARLLAWVKGHPGASLLPTGVLRAPAPWESAERVSGTLAALRDLG